MLKEKNLALNQNKLNLEPICAKIETFCAKLRPTLVKRETFCAKLGPACAKL